MKNLPEDWSSDGTRALFVESQKLELSALDTFGINPVRSYFTMGGPSDLFTPGAEEDLNGQIHLFSVHMLIVLANVFPKTQDKCCHVRYERMGMH